MEILVKEKGLQFNLEVETEIPKVMADTDRILQVLNNLASNAVKFTDSGSITCKARQENGYIRFSVQDTGRGIPPGERSNFFDRFRQLGDVLTNRPRGTGLGLAISKEIVKQHGGSIGLESEPDKAARSTSPCLWHNDGAPYVRR